MAMELKQIDSLFSDIRDGKATLLLGQEYFKVDEDYYYSVLTRMNIKNDTPSFNSLWVGASERLGTAMSAAAESTSFQPWLRAILSLGWSMILSSLPNRLWLKNGIGGNFGLNILTQEELTGTPDPNKFLNKQKPYYVSLFGDESSLPEEKKLRKLKNKTDLLNMIYNEILPFYGYFVLDGLADDDWFYIGKLLNNIDAMPSYHIYIFGTDKKKVERLCKDDEDWDQLNDYIDEGQIVLCGKSLKDIVIELGMDEAAEEASQEANEDKVRISLPNSDAVYISRQECTRLNRMGIILMRDELFSSFILNDENKDKAFANFIGQRDKKDLRYFDVVYNRKRISFHIPRDVEGLLTYAVSKQLNKRREIILLKGDSNSGKTTSLFWFARQAVKEGIGKGKNSKYVVLLISGDPACRESDWQDVLVEFIKEQVKPLETVKGDRIRNVIIIWDNYNSSHKKRDYIELYNKLNECNAVLIGSIYSFESICVDSPVVQGVAFNELKPLHTTLEGDAKTELNKLLKIINNDWSLQKQEEHLFETLVNFAKYRYSPEWNKVRTVLKSGLYKEARISEGVSNDLFNIFKNKNPNDFNDVKRVVQSLGFGSKTQAQFLAADPDRQERNIPLINSIQKMNLILAVANQFRNSLKLPLSILMRAISDGKQYTGDYSKLNKILRTDSMIEYDSDLSTGSIMVSFRHPSEAIAYLDNNLGSESERKEKEIGVVNCMIENCRWDNYEEARAVAALVRSFGTNSYGKVNDDQPVQRGQYGDYSEYWMQIAKKLNACAGSNPEAMLISGHFTRDYIEESSPNNSIEILESALDNMNGAVERCGESRRSTRSRLYGEICRNLLEQMKIYSKSGDRETVVELSYDFNDYFQLAVKSGVESRQRNSFSLPLLLDIWLNYVIEIHDRDDKLLPDTLEYIDILFYNESNLIDDSNDYVNVLSGIDKIYEKVKDRSISDLRNIMNKNNDSFAYFRIKQILVKLLLKYKEELPQLFDPEAISNKNDARTLSNRIFFMNEIAADDFKSYHALDPKVSVANVFKDIKKELKVASKEIIEVLESEFTSPDEMSYRCLLMYIKAKWMSYTGNLLLEPNQRPALKEEQWRELANICKTANANMGDSDVIARSLEFIQNIYTFVFEGKKWEGHRYAAESPMRLICLCGSEKEENKGVPRRFRVSVKEGDRSDKLYAEIDCEMVGSVRIKTPIVGQKKIYVPETIGNYRDIKRHNLNIDRDFMIWFNLGGPQLRDFDLKQEV